MKKYLRLLLIAISTLILLILILFGIVLLSMKYQKKRMNERLDEQIKNCNKSEFICGNNSVQLIDFKNNEIDSLNFILLRNGKHIKDSLIKFKDNSSYIVEVNIPFKRLKKNDTIILKTKGGLQFYISEFKYTAGLLYGMFGPVAMTACYNTNKYTINNKKNTNIISKYAGKRFLKDKKTFVFANDPSFDSISNLYNINSEKLHKILVKNSPVERYKYMNSILGLQKNKDSTCYIFSQKVSYNKKVYGKVSAHTGVYSINLKK